MWVATGSPLEVKKKLDELGFLHLSYLALIKYSELPLLDPPFIMDFESDFKENYEQYKSTYNLLADKKSQEIFTKVINFKISFDYNFMEGFSNNHSEQYFDKEIVPKIKNIHFFDAGAYVGDTAIEVIRNYSDYAKIWLVEPIAEHMRIAKRDLADYENIEFITAGVGSKKETLNFHEEKSFSTMQGNGKESVQIETIDAIVQNSRVDFIKLDVEGAELAAIEGARDSIQRCRPVLAVCIYHKAEDWYKVPKLILSIDKNYKMYLRHYMEGIFESVAYFIPQNK